MAPGTMCSDDQSQGVPHFLEATVGVSAGELLRAYPVFLEAGGRGHPPGILLQRELSRVSSWGHGMGNNRNVCLRETVTFDAAALFPSF